MVNVNCTSKLSLVLFCTRLIQVLSDSLKKRNYDLTGRVGESPPQHTGFPRGQGFTFHQGGFRFVFPSGPTHRSDGISTQQFYDDILSNSHHKPYLLNFYSDFCMHCANVEMIWKALHMVRGRKLLWTFCCFTVWQLSNFILYCITPFVYMCARLYIVM